MENRVKILGVRGSIPVSGPQYRNYGVATTCVVVNMAGETVILDAGTGLLNLPEDILALPRLRLFLSHPHADHLLGLPVCPYVMDSSKRLEIYAEPRNGFDCAGQVASLLSPPLWPVTPEQLPARIACHDLTEPVELGRITVSMLEGVHPGGVTLFRLTGGGKSVVFATDCTLTETLLPRLVDFAGGCDLLLCDGQISPDEWAEKAGFGHSTWAAAARLGADCGAKKVRIIHHDPGHTDAMLDAASAEVRSICPECAFAVEGEEITL